MYNSSNLKGVILACVSSAFIGSSFIIKKKGLKRAGGAGARAGVGGYGYLMEPLWWVGMGTRRIGLLNGVLWWLVGAQAMEFVLDIVSIDLSPEFIVIYSYCGHRLCMMHFGPCHIVIVVIVGEIANFVAYIYAPAVLVTPLGALSIIVSAILAHCLLDEKLQKMGMIGCLLCIVGSTVIVLHAPGERSLNSVDEIWGLAIQPAFLSYTAAVVAVALVLILYCAPRYGQTNIMIYIGICSIIGSLTVMSVKAIGIAIKLTLDGANQFKYIHAWIFAMVSVTCIIIQLNYLNMALDTFNTAVVSPIYYAMFTSFTILASAIMFQDYYGQSISSIASELCGFITVLSGTTILHSTREPDQPFITDLYTPLSPQVSWHMQSNGDLWKHRDEDVHPHNSITILQQDYFK